MRILSLTFAAALLFVSVTQAQTIFKNHRYDDDVNLLIEKQPWLSGIKNIAIGSTRLDVGGEARISREWSINPDFGKGINQAQGYWLGRYALHFNLKMSEDFRLFTQFKYSNVEGKDGEPGKLDDDYLDVQQLFLDKLWMNSDGNSFLRIGRQEASIGSGRWVSLREGPNSRLTFDSLLWQQRFGEQVLELFAGRPTLIEREDFDNKQDPDQLFVVLSGNRFWKIGDSVVDGYLIYFQDDVAEYRSVSGTEERYGVGTRWMTGTGDVKGNTDVMFQWGRVNDTDIVAYGLASEILWRRSPVLSYTTKLSYFTGDGATGDGQLSTFNAFYPRGTYYGWSAQIGHPNLVAIQPGAVYFLRDDLRFASDIGFYWRQSKGDTIYRGNSTPLSFANVDSDQNFIGSQFNALLEWQTTPVVVTSLEYSYFYEDMHVDELKDAQFIGTRVYFKF
jgi:hypothetical protein